jgi:hypothetical protein
MKKAFEWELSQLPCFYTSPDEENNLKPSNYLLRTSNTTGDALVIAYRDAATLEAGARAHSTLGQVALAGWHRFAGWRHVRRLHSPRAAEGQHSAQRRLARAAAAAADVDALGVAHRIGRAARAESSCAVDRGLSATTRCSRRWRRRPARCSTASSRTCTAASAPRSSLRKRTTRTCFEGTVWTGVARTEALAALNPKHDDLNGVSLASEPWYFFDLDTFGANAILAGLASRLVPGAPQLVDDAVCRVVCARGGDAAGAYSARHRQGAAHRDDSMRPSLALCASW